MCFRPPGSRANARPPAAVNVQRPVTFNFPGNPVNPVNPVAAHSITHFQRELTVLSSHPRFILFLFWTAAGAEDASGAGRVVPDRGRNPPALRANRSGLLHGIAASRDTGRLPQRLSRFAPLDRRVRTASSSHKIGICVHCPCFVFMSSVFRRVRARRVHLAKPVCACTVRGVHCHQSLKRPHPWRTPLCIYGLR
jgi:hypothetical protein